MKKIFTSILLSAFVLLVINSTVQADNSINWFIKQNGDHNQPSLMGGGTTYPEYGVKGIGNKDDKIIYLTFDAGYGNGNVTKILDVLMKHDVKGAFFILSGLIKYSPEIVKRIADEGHIVCNHTSSHKNIANMSKEELQRDLTILEDYYKETTGKELSKYFRPPEGSFSVESLKNLHSLGYKTVFWSFAYADWDNGKQPDPKKSLDKILANVHNGMVMLLHPNSATNTEILDELIVTLIEQGYTFETLDHLYAQQ